MANNNPCQMDRHFASQIAMTRKEDDANMVDLAKEVQELQDAHNEVVAVLGEVIATISNPTNADSTVRDLHEVAARTWKNYFDAPEPAEGAAG